MVDRQPCNPRAVTYHEAALGIAYRAATMARETSGPCTACAALRCAALRCAAAARGVDGGAGAGAEISTYLSVSWIVM